MRWAVALALSLAVCACGSSSDEKLQGIEVRQLSGGERDALRRAFAQGLADPGAAQFKWMPVLLAMRGGATPYCGLISAKPRTGADTGFRKFSARIQQANGLYVQGVIDHVEGSPPIFAGANPAGDGTAQGTAAMAKRREPSSSGPKAVSPARIAGKAEAQATMVTATAAIVVTSGRDGDGQISATDIWAPQGWNIMRISALPSRLTNEYFEALL